MSWELKRTSQLWPVQGNIAHPDRNLKQQSVPEVNPSWEIPRKYVLDVTSVDQRKCVLDVTSVGQRKCVLDVTFVGQRKYVLYVTSIGQRSSPCTCNSVKVEMKSHLECKLHFPSAQPMLRQMNLTNVSEGIVANYWVSWLSFDI